MKSMIRALLITLLTAVTAFCAAERPNIVVILTDDLGYSDIGCYGGEIETPNLDSLASNGLRFSQFYNTAKCHSSRVSLLSGQYCAAAGDTALSHAVTSAEVLRDAGYFTAMTGKWHLTKEPTDFGFQRYFGHLSGACNYFSGDGTFRLNAKRWDVPESHNGKPFYTTVANMDFALDFLKEARKIEKPFYLYVAFNAPHAPLHALPEDYAKYKGRYSDGWDKIRDARIAKQKKLGLLPDSLEPSPRPPHVRAWKDLVPWQRDYEINRMQTLAAMIDRIDQEVGRLIADLKQHGEFENTLILFVSDNGACPYDRSKPLLNVEPTSAAVSLADSTGWAWARNAPFRFYKQNQFEGGISTPGIVHWPAGLKTKPGAVIDTPAHLIDVLPTLADLASTTVPEKHPERDLRPVSGVSLRPLFEGKDVVRKEPIHLCFGTDYGLRDGAWKLVNFKGQEWELYNLAQDRTELKNLAEGEPERLLAMDKKWRQMSREVLHSERLADRQLKPAVMPKHNPEWTAFSDQDTPDAASPGKSKRKSKGGATPQIRARKNTSLSREQDGSIALTFTGEDPGIAIDLRGMEDLPPGPYMLSMKLTTALHGQGEILYTLDPETSLPAGKSMPITIDKCAGPQSINIKLDVHARLHQLRIDLTEESGQATIHELRLMDAKGTVLIDFTPSK